ncbi:SURF1 family protein [Streptomyces sp. NPDC006309]|uniref:SURF1 family protein n=1 Tax=Streptomyces sp. NPDC006309 TaxID=3156749 RepID=UPI0033B1644B
MGTWQLDRFAARVESHQEDQQHHGVSPADRTAAPLDDLLPVTELTSGRLATATGHYDASFLVPGRELDGRAGSYVLTLLRTEHGDALPVVRGWLPGRAGAAEIPAPPAGKVTVTGALQPRRTEARREPTRTAGCPAVRSASSTAHRW